MVTQISCSCGNNDPQKSKEYDGLLGYQAIICTECGRYSDHDGEHEADDWSANFLKEVIKMDNLKSKNNMKKTINVAMAKSYNETTFCYNWFLNDFVQWERADFSVTNHYDTTYVNLEDAKKLATDLRLTDFKIVEVDISEVE